MHFKLSDTYQNRIVRSKLYSKGGSIQGDLSVTGSTTLNSANINTIIDSQNSSGNYGDILTTNPSNGKMLWSYQGNQYKGSDMFPIDFLDISSIPLPPEIDLNTQFNWHGAVLSKIGNIYFVPRHIGLCFTLAKHSPINTALKIIKILYYKFLLFLYYI